MFGSSFFFFLNCLIVYLVYTKYASLVTHFRLNFFKLLSSALFIIIPLKVFVTMLMAIKLYETIYNYNFEASRSAGAQACDSKRYRLWVRFPLEKVKY